MLYPFDPSSAEGYTIQQATSSPDITLTQIAVTQTIAAGNTTDSPTPTATSQVQDVSKQEFSGEVTKIDGRKLTINTSDGTKEITVPDNLQIKKNGFDSKFEEIKVNDKVSFAQNPNGELLSISATSAEASDFSKRVLPFVIGGLIILGLLFYLLSQRSKGHVKTTTENIKE